jgi:hypothetical protein
MKVKFYRIGDEFKRIKKPYLKKVDKIFTTGNFILGNSNKKFEKKISKLLNVKYVCGVGNGSDALEIGLLAIGVKKGDEVILTKHEHVGNAGPWLNRSKIDGIVIKTLDLGFTAEETIENFKKMYNFYGYEICEDYSYENDYEKIAFYVKNNIPTHAAKQFNNLFLRLLHPIFL